MRKSIIERCDIVIGSVVNGSVVAEVNGSMKSDRRSFPIRFVLIFIQ